MKALALEKYGDEAKLEEVRQERLQKRMKRKHIKLQQAPDPRAAMGGPLEEAYTDALPRGANPHTLPNPYHVQTTNKTWPIPSPLC